MGNKEPKVFKALVHKKSGKFGMIMPQGYSPYGGKATTYTDPVPYPKTMTVPLLIEEWGEIEGISEYELKEFVSISIEEYKKLKGD